MIKYLILAAQQGDPIALYNLGSTYEELILHDVAKKKWHANQAIKNYRKAAEQNFAHAKKRMHEMHHCAKCGIQTKKRCSGCLLTAYCSPTCQLQHWPEHQKKCVVKASVDKMQPESSSSVDTDAHYQAGCAYVKNMDNTADSKEREILFNKALDSLTQAHNPAAAHLLGSLYQEKMSQCTDAQKKAECERNAVYWYERGAERDYVQSQYALGYLYHHKSVSLTDENLMLAQICYGKAAQQGHVAAQYELGHIYRKKSKQAPNDEQKKLLLTKALDLLEKAAQQGDAFDHYNLGRIYMKLDRRSGGLLCRCTRASCDQNEELFLDKTYKQFEFAALQGHRNAQFELGWVCMRKYHKAAEAEKNEFLEKAITWLEKVVRSKTEDPLFAPNIELAWALLGEAYEEKSERCEDQMLAKSYILPKAIAAYEQAAQSNIVEAQTRLVAIYENLCDYTSHVGQKDIFLKEAIEWQQKVLAALESEAAKTLTPAEFTLGRLFYKRSTTMRILHKENKLAYVSGTQTAQPTLEWSAQLLGNALLWLEKSAQQGYIEAQILLGDHYRAYWNNEFPSRDDEYPLDKALEYYEMATPCDHKALWSAGELWLEKYTFSDFKLEFLMKALDRIKKAVCFGKTDALDMLRKCYNLMKTHQACARCGTNCSKKCQRCDIPYCSSECIKEDWAIHQKICKK